MHASRDRDGAAPVAPMPQKYGFGAAGTRVRDFGASGLDRPDTAGTRAAGPDRARVTGPSHGFTDPSPSRRSRPDKPRGPGLPGPAAAGASGSGTDSRAIAHDASAGLFVAIAATSDPNPAPSARPGATRTTRRRRPHSPVPSGPGPARPARPGGAARMTRPHPPGPIRRSRRRYPPVAASIRVRRVPLSSSLCRSSIDSPAMSRPST